MRRSSLTSLRVLRRGWLAGLACGAVFAQPALAQQDRVDVIAQPVVQQVPASKGMRLNDALGDLARNPQDVGALINAAQASLQIGDVDAAVGFYRRAERLSPGNARVKAGLASAYALSEDPFTAIPLFAEAEQAGVLDSAALSDRGLAHDLVGDTASAQKYYRMALALAPSDDAVRRLALSQAIAGDRRGMEVTLSPLLQRQDKAAWRARAFGLAILGQADEAEAIIRTAMPQDMAEAMRGYIRYMPRLTAAQQAAAANLGHFPRPADIGRDDPRAAAFQPKRVPVLAVAEPSAAPQGKSGRQAKDRDRRSSPVRVLTMPVQPNVADLAASVQEASVAPDPSASTAVANELPPLGATAVPVAPPRVVASAPAAPQPAVPVAQVVMAPTALSTPAPVAPQTSAQPGFTSLPAPAKTAPARPAPAPARVRSLADVFADLTPPSREAEPAAGAVDLRRLTTDRPAAAVKAPPVLADGKSAQAKLADAKSADAKSAEGKTAAAKTSKKLALDDCTPESAKDAKSRSGKGTVKGAKAAKPAKGSTAADSAACATDPKLAKAKSPAASQPSRIWVQLATGKAKSALAFDWRRMAKENPELLGKLKPATSAWGANTRLLAGPFDSEKAAAALVTKLKKAGMGGVFVWTSPAGQVVDPLAAGK